MTALGVTDPRGWTTKDWVADIVPHLAYGAVTAAVLHQLDYAPAAQAGKNGELLRGTDQRFSAIAAWAACPATTTYGVTGCGDVFGALSTRGCPGPG